MAHKIGKKRKVLLIVAGFLLAAIFVVGLYLTSHFEQIVVSELSRVTEEGSNGLYKLKVGGVNIRVFRGKLEMRNLSLSADTIVYNRLKQTDTAPRTAYDIHVKALRINISSWWPIIRKRHLTIGELDVINPNVVVTADTTIHRSEEPVQIGQDINKILKQVFAVVDIREVNIRNGHLYFYSNTIPGKAGFVMEKVNMLIQDISFDSSFMFRNIKIPYWSSLRCKVGRIANVFPGEHFALGINGVAFNYNDSLLICDSIALMPQHTKYEFAKAVPGRTDWMEFNTGRTVVSGIRISEFLTYERLHIDSIAIQNPSFASFKNRKVPPPLREKPLFYKLLHHIPFEVNVPKLEMQDGIAAYEELKLTADSPGKITFTNMNLSFSGITNKAVSENQSILCRGFTKIMGRGDLNATFTFPVDKDDQHWTIMGTLGSMDLRGLNGMIIPLANISIERGNVKRMDISITGTDHTASINMLFLYNNLKINVLNKEGNKTGLASKVVNEYVLTPENPTDGQEPRRVRMTVQRDIYRSLFHFWWNPIFAGIKETVGFTEKKQEALKSVKEFVDDFKNNRNEQKGRRKKKKK